MNNKSFKWQIEFPYSKDPLEMASLVNDIIGDLQNQQTLMFKSMSKYKNELIKKYKLNSFINLFYFDKFGVFDLSGRQESKISRFQCTISFFQNSNIPPIIYQDHFSGKIPPNLTYLDILEKINENHISINDPWRIEIRDFRTHELKTQINVKFEIDLFLNPESYTVDLINKNECNHDLRLVSKRGVGAWALIWECVNCGFTCYCSCFKKAIKKHNQLNERMKIDTYPFYPNACEVCRRLPSSHQYCNKMYARSQFELRYGAYIKKKVYEIAEHEDQLFNKDIERRASNELRKELGFKKIGEGFVVETELYRLVKSIFPNENVIHHYRAGWLGMQELDIYILERKIGIEYQGEQHYTPIESWGGEEGLKRNIERDRAKRKKCEDNGVLLIEFTHNEKEKFSRSYVKTRLFNGIEANR